MSKIRNTIIIGVIGLVLTFLGIILPYFTISVFGYGTSISLFGYWEGKVILVLLFASLLFICKDYIEKLLPQLFDSWFGSKIKDANPKFVLIPTILMAVFAIWLFFSIEIDMTYIKYGIGFWLLWIGIICLLVHSFIYKKPIAENNSYYQPQQNANMNNQFAQPTQTAMPNQNANIMNNNLNADIKVCPNCGSKCNINADRCFMCGKEL